jgi:hypothetical protein
MHILERLTRALPPVLLLGLLASGCGDDDGDGSMNTMGDAGDVGSCESRPTDAGPDPGQCTPRDDDYSPCADDAWPACISDDGEYHRIEQTISSIARVAAFEEIADLLFDPAGEPSAEDFLQARMIYQEDEGLDSRVVRRYDPHYQVDDGVDCTLAADAEDHPDYCVGPARIQPLILGALQDGMAGDQPTLQAARVEAGLLWFLFVSTYKESFTCTTKAKDCDSSWAYYTGGEPARGGLGLSRYVREVDAYAHDRAWDGLLAQRCWRDLDDAEVAEELSLRDRARGQADRAITDGLAAIVRDRLQRVQQGPAAEADYHWITATVLGAVLDREARARDAGGAAALQAVLAEADPADADPGAGIAALDDLFECP